MSNLTTSPTNNLRTELTASHNYGSSTGQEIPCLLQTVKGDDIFPHLVLFW
jgi:hypothetical protein